MKTEGNEVGEVTAVRGDGPYGSTGPWALLMIEMRSHWGVLSSGMTIN